jgi:hypothetical protein
MIACAYRFGQPKLGHKKAQKAQRRVIRFVPFVLFVAALA